MFKVEHFGDDVFRHLLNIGVVIFDVGVVEAAGGLDFVFGVGKFSLQFQEVGVGFEVRIGFGYGKERFQSRGQGVFSFGLFLRCVRRDGLTSGFGNFFKRFAFMLSVAFNGVDEVGDKIVASFKLDIYIAPGFFYLVALFNQAVISHETVTDYYGQDN